jgi:hypothetical protein
MIPPTQALTTLLLVPAQVRLRFPTSHPTTTTQMRGAAVDGDGEPSKRPVVTRQVPKSSRIGTREGASFTSPDGARSRSVPRGKAPNIDWQAITMEDLRAHPLYGELPHPLEVDLGELGTLSAGYTDPASLGKRMMLQQFRQDSWQWDALHAGRLTTSKAASCLGFYEERAGKKLGVPRSLRGHMKALNAWRDLCEPPCSLSAFAGEHHRQQRLHKQQQKHKQHQQERSVWVRKTERAPATGGSIRASHDHRPKGTKASQRNSGGRRHYHSSLGSVRMAWGSAQEPTSLLNVLNAVASLDGTAAEESAAEASDAARAAALLASLEDDEGGSEVDGGGSRDCDYDGGARLEEAGLRMLELAEAPADVAQLWQCANPATIVNASSAAAAAALLVGASPDGIIRYSNGSLVAVEVKNHAPYQTVGYAARSSPAVFEVNDRGPMRQIGAWHVAQLQLEMLCIGDGCRSAIFASCSATRGLALFRVERDDAYLHDMLAILRVFHDRYVRNIQGGGRPRPPPANFFSSDPPDLVDGARYGLREGDYERFLARTANIAKDAKVWCRVPEREMQRSGVASSPFHDHHQPAQRQPTQQQPAQQQQQQPAQQHAVQQQPSQHVVAEPTTAPTPPPVATDAAATAAADDARRERQRLKRKRQRQRQKERRKEERQKAEAAAGPALMQPPSSKAAAAGQGPQHAQQQHEQQESHLNNANAKTADEKGKEEGNIEEKGGLSNEDGKGA